MWRSAVRATHDFLAESDFERIEANLATTYFPAVSMIVAARGTRVLGFAGVADDSLEMLFVEASAHEQGIGTALLAEATAFHGVAKVDVNEQNISAIPFYLGRGFRQVGRSDLDGDGRPYPILHLEIPRPQ